MKTLVLHSGGLDGQARQEDWLRSTAQIDKDTFLVRDEVERLIRGARTDRDKAQRVYRFVRDEIRFGWTSEFYDVKASDVLRSGVGYGNRPRGGSSHHFLDVVLHGTCAPTVHSACGAAACH